MHRYRPERLDWRVYRDFALGSLSRLGPLANEQIQSLLQALTDIETFPQGQELITEGAIQDQPRLLVEGWALRQRTLADGRRQIFGFILPGDVFGLCAHPDHIAMCSIVAATPLLSCPLSFVAKAMQQECGALKEFAWRMISLEEAGLRDQVVRLGRQSAHERLVHLLLEFYGRLKEVGKVYDSGFALPLSQEVLSDALGLSVVHTNRTLQQLRREQLIETRGGHVILSDPQRMGEIAGYRTRWFVSRQADAQASVMVPSCSSAETVTSIPSA